MAEVEVAHFSVPFRYVAGKALVVEQDTLEEIRQCIEAALRTELGFRDEAPDFGTEDTTFQTVPIDTGTLVNQVITSEPRAVEIVDMDQSIHPLDELILQLIRIIQQPEGGAIQ